MRLFFCSILGMCLLVLTENPARAQTPPAGVAIPALGLISMEQGTIECWIKMGVEPSTPIENVQPGVLFMLTASEPAIPSGFAISFGRLRGVLHLRLGAVMDGKEMDPPAWLAPAMPAGQSWHHIAVTWTGGRQVSIFWDGKMLLKNHTFQDRSFALPISSKGALLLGQPTRSLIAIDELRVSSYARSESELAAAATGPLQPDPGTVLLLSFDEAAPDARQVVATHAATPAAAFVKVSESCSIVPGKFGQALGLAQSTFFPADSR